MPGPPPSASSDARPRPGAWLPRLWAVLLVGLLLGPALGAGYVLSYDLVFVPQQALRGDFLGLGTGLPRAVPGDAVVAVLDNVVPAMLLQKLALAGGLLLAAEGMVRLVGESTVARLVAVSVAVWNPFTVERLGIGHWTVLLAYGAVPWLALAGAEVRRAGRLPTVAWLLAPLASLSASAGLVAAATLLVTGATRPRGRGRRRGQLGLLGLVLAANAPWAVAGLLHADIATGDVGARWFGLHADGALPAPLAALTLGGIWNREVVPASRGTGLAWLGLLLLAVLAVAGARSWWRSRPDRRRLLALWGLGTGLAWVSWAAPGLVGWTGEHVPGGGLLRDAPRLLALCLPVYAGLVAAGAERLAALLRHPGLAVPRVAAAATCAVLPVAVIPDAAWGIGGALTPAHYPASWSEARDLADPGEGDLLVLPLASYRAPSWNHDRTVLDPLGRFLRPDYLASDELQISGRSLAGEDPRVPEVRAALGLGDPAARARGLAELGIRYVAEERDTGLPAGPAVAGERLLDASDLQLTRLDGTRVRESSWATRGWLTAAWLAYLAAYAAAVARLLRAARIRGFRGSSV